LADADESEETEKELSGDFAALGAAASLVCYLFTVGTHAPVAVYVFVCAHVCMPLYVRVCTNV
jgi:hypothetical protein